MGTIDWHLADWLLLAILSSLGIGDAVIVIRATPLKDRCVSVYGKNLSLFLFVWGAIGGRIWSPMNAFLPEKWWLMVMVLMSAGVFVAYFHNSVRKWVHLPDWTPFVYLALGVPVGMYFWPVTWPL